MPSFDLATWKSLGGLDETCFGRLVGTKACLEHGEEKMESEE